MAYKSCQTIVSIWSRRLGHKAKDKHLYTFLTFWHRNGRENARNMLSCKQTSG
jgi:hypothetical protein